MMDLDDLVIDADGLGLTTEFRSTCEGDGREFSLHGEAALERTIKINDWLPEREAKKLSEKIKGHGAIALWEGHGASFNVTARLYPTSEIRAIWKTVKKTDKRLPKGGKRR